MSRPSIKLIFLATINFIKLRGALIIFDILLLSIFVIFFALFSLSIISKIYALSNQWTPEGWSPNIFPRVLTSLLGVELVKYFFKLALSYEYSSFLTVQPISQKNKLKNTVVFTSFFTVVIIISIQIFVVLYTGAPYWMDFGLPFSIGSIIALSALYWLATPHTEYIPRNFFSSNELSALQKLRDTYAKKYGSKKPQHLPSWWALEGSSNKEKSTKSLLVISLVFLSVCLSLVVLSFTQRNSMYLLVGTFFFSIYLLNLLMNIKGLRLDTLRVQPLLFTSYVLKGVLPSIYISSAAFLCLTICGLLGSIYSLGFFFGVLFVWLGILLSYCGILMLTKGDKNRAWLLILLILGLSFTSFGPILLFFPVFIAAAALQILSRRHYYGHKY